MKAIQCEACNYKFQREEVPSRCPYCGKDGTPREQKLAQDWLDEED